MGRHVRSGPMALLLLLAGFGCEDDTLQKLAGELQSDQVVDFGDVQVGIQKVIALQLSNAGGAVVSVENVDRDASISGSRYEFEVSADGFDVRAGTLYELVLKFRPFQPMDMPAESTIRLMIDGEAYEVVLRGRGVESGLIVDPNPVEFGAVLLGATHTIDVSITNALSEDVTVFTRTARGAIEVESTGGTGRFEVVGTVEPDGSLGRLAPGESLTVAATYIPADQPSNRDDRGRFFVSNCEFDLCEVTVSLSGNGTDSALECLPASLDFERVNPGVVRTLPVTCTNLASDSVNIVSAYVPVVSAPEFSTAGVPSGTTVEPGMSVDIDVAFAPTQATYDSGVAVTGTLDIEATSNNGSVLEPVRIQLTGRAGGPTIEVTPERLDFGIVAIGTSHTKRLLVLNSGFDPLEVSAIDADLAATGAFMANASVITLPPGGAQIVEVAFSPQAEGPVTSELTFTSNDTARPVVTVALSGQGVTLPPCAYSITPPNINFGQVPLSEAPTRGFRVENIGTDVCLLNDVDFVPPTNTATNAFVLVGGPQTNITLAPGEFRDFPVRYTPTRVGSDMAAVGMYISDPRNSNPTVPLFGVGDPLLRIECPTPITTAVGTPVTLVSSPQVSGANITGFAWTIVNSPTGGAGTPGQWTPAPANAPTEAFLPLIVGTYDIRVDVFDDVNRTASCVTSVIAQGEGLVATLRWNGPGDVDLHVHNQVTTQPWFSNPDDCYYGNRSPIWDPGFGAGIGPNPELDFDNTTANGPENTRISTPILNQPYTIGIHNYSSAAGRTATIEIFCGGVSMPTYVATSRPLQGTVGGNCSANDFWRVATVTFTTAGTCLVTPINTYTASSQACISF